MAMSRAKRDEALASIRKAREELTAARSHIVTGSGLGIYTLKAAQALERAQHHCFDAKDLCRTQVEEDSRAQTSA